MGYMVQFKDVNGHWLDYCIVYSITDALSEVSRLTILDGVKARYKLVK